jgi:transcriptional regulator with XRE-family HTH domain
MNGTELRKRRKERGMGQRELSRLSRVPQQAISAAENGREVLSRGATRRLEQALQK